MIIRNDSILIEEEARNKEIENIYNSILVEKQEERFINPEILFVLKSKKMEVIKEGQFIASDNIEYIKEIISLSIDSIVDEESRKVDLNRDQIFLEKLKEREAAKKEVEAKNNGEKSIVKNFNLSAKPYSYLPVEKKGKPNLMNYSIKENSVTGFIPKTENVVTKIESSATEKKVIERSIEEQDFMEKEDMIKYLRLIYLDILTDIGLKYVMLKYRIIRQKRYTDQEIMEELDLKYEDITKYEQDVSKLLNLETSNLCEKSKELVKTYNNEN